MSGRSKISFFVSLFAHLGIVASLFIVLGSVLKPAPPSPILIEVSETFQPPGAAASGSGQSGKRRVSRRKSRSFQIKDLGVKYGWQSPPPNALGQTSGDEASSQTEGGRGDSKPFDLAAEGKQNPLFKYVHDEVENNLVYPAELKNRFIQGTVSGAIVFSKGEFLESQTRLSSDSSYLRVAVIRALRKAFRENLPAELWKLASDQNERVEVEARFQFAIVEHSNEEKRQTHEGISGHSIAFYREFEHSVLQWQLGPLSGLGPLVSLNVLWLPQKIGEMLSKKAVIDPLDSYRDDPAY